MTTDYRNDVTDAPKTLVLLDPTAPHGEAALRMLDNEDTHVALVVMMSGPSARALHSYAKAEEIDVATAADHYLDQVANRIQRPDRLVEVVRSTGVNADAELANLAAFGPTKRVLRPSVASDEQRPVINLAAAGRRLSRWARLDRAA